MLQHMQFLPVAHDNRDADHMSKMMRGKVCASITGDVPASGLQNSGLLLAPLFCQIFQQHASLCTGVHFDCIN